MFGFGDKCARIPLKEASNTIRRGELSSCVSGWSLSSLGLSLNRHIGTKKGESASCSSQVQRCVLVVADEGCSFRTIMSQVFGGPLRSLHMIHDGPFPQILLEFIEAADANVFRRHVESNLCIVKGTHIVSIKPTQSNLDLLVPTEGGKSKDNFLRRRLELFHPVSVTGKRILEVPELNPAVIRNWFSRFGVVLEVRPMFRPKAIAFSIEFTSVNDACLAKSEFDSFQQLGSEEPSDIAMLQGWSMAFLSDTTEREMCVKDDELM